MTNKEKTPPLSPSLIDELNFIREALKKIPAISSVEDIPMLDEIIKSQQEGSDFCEIPVLADSVMKPNKENHRLAMQSWKIIEKMLYQWTRTMDNPLSLLSKELFQGMSPQLASNWEAIFSKQTPQQLQKWKQWLKENN